MHRFFTWLLVFGVLAGLGGRALAADGSRIAVCMEALHDCGGDHDHDHDHDSPAHGHEHDHGDDCPSDHHHHHHHGACFQVIHLAVEKTCAACLCGPAPTWLALSHEREPLPDGPVLASDKPPLI